MKLGIHNNTNFLIKKNIDEFKKKILQDITDFEDYIKNNCLDFYNPFENFELLESCGESKVNFIFKRNKNENLLKLEISEKRVIISQKLKHKNIINKYSENNEDNTLGNITNFLTNIIKQNKFSETMLCYIAFQILKGLKYCQNCKIVHYNLKPENIIINNQVNVMLTDFSVSLDYSKITNDEIKLYFCGKSLYMPPEVILGRNIKLKDINKIDLYSLGVILYRFAFCCYPFGLTHKDSKDCVAVYEKIMNNKLEIDKNYNYSDYFVDFLKKLLEKDINKRININEALEHLWIKGADILMDEKEKINNDNIFIMNLITDSFYNFNNYLK